MARGAESSLDEWNRRIAGKIHAYTSHPIEPTSPTIKQISQAEIPAAMRLMVGLTSLSSERIVQSTISKKATTIAMSGSTSRT